MIQVENAAKHYGGVVAVHDISFHVAQGELLVLLGTSGCGKTTTLKMINRLITPTLGTIHVDGKDIQSVDPVQLRRQIGYVFQGIGLFPHMTVGKNVAMVPKLCGWKPDRIRERIDELLTLVNLPPDQFRDRMPGELSGGQRQRVGFARALAVGPRVMLLDEPFGALDPLTRNTLQDEFRRIQKQLNLTAVMVTHDMTEALLLADRIAVMHEGRIVRLGTPHELLTDPQDPFVDALMQTPRRQAGELDRLTHSPSSSNTTPEAGA
jgi:osmoprotectant transport system ATP-binding protein